MKALLVGFIFLIAVAIFAGIATLLLPFLIALVWFLRVIAVFVLFILAIWLLGKFIIFVWEKIK